VNVAANAMLRRGNLPFELTSFVGRRHETAEVRKLLGQSRLVTLTGFGGVGKTRLALRVAAEAERGYRDGVWLVDLAPLHDPGLVTQAVIAALGIRDRANSRSLGDFLRNRQTLLLMDNCEHLLDACAALADELLQSASELTILATSRQPLGVRGEQIFAVPSLPTPDVDAPVPPAEALARYDSLALLVERGQAAEPSFAITAENAEAVTRLAQRLEGIPLALELVAARLRVLSAQQILDRLGDQYDLLTSTSRAASPRQESLQALIDWSFDLCTEQERALWARLSVFPRDFDIEAAEEICADDELPRDRVLRALSGLVDKSIVIADDRVSGKRYRMPETLREYSRTRLARAGSEVTLRRRHRDHFLRLATQDTTEWFGPRQAERTAWAHAEYLNLRAALEHCLTVPGQATEGLALVPALVSHWAVIGSLGEGRRFLDRALAAFPEPSAARAGVLWIAARLALEQGDISAAETAAEEGRRLAQDHADPRALSMSLGQLGAINMLRGEPAAARRLLDEAVHTAGDDPLATSIALIGSAFASIDRGDVAVAAHDFKRCLAICERHEESRIRAEALWGHALLSWQQGDTAAAKEMAKEALRCIRKVANRMLLERCLEILAWIAAAESRYEPAARHLGAAAAIRDALGVQLFPNLARPHDECEERLRSALGQREFAKLTRQGARIAIDEAVADALGEQADATARPAGEEAALTRREHEVADLVAQGLSNRDIAASLVISPRTAEAHVEHILTKLGFTSRSQIAAWVAERRAVSPDPD